MSVDEEYAALIGQQDTRHAVALAENRRLKAEVNALRGITLTQEDIDAVISNLGEEKLPEYRHRRELEHMMAEVLTVAMGRVW